MSVVVVGLVEQLRSAGGWYRMIVGQSVVRRMIAELERIVVVGEMLGKVPGPEVLGRWRGNEFGQREGVALGRKVVEGMGFVQTELRVVCRERVGSRMCSPLEMHRSRMVGC